MRPRVLIVGGGIIGLTTAYRLAQRGCRVQVLERGEPGREASWAGAGILPPGHPERAATPLDQLRARSVAGFAAFSHELRQQTGYDNGYRITGGLEFLQDHELDLVLLWEAEGLAYWPVEPTQVEPNLAPTACQVFELPGFAQVRNPWHLRALTAACHRAGVELHPHCEVHRFQHAQDRVETVESTSGRHLADEVLITGGAWTGLLLRQLGVTVPVHPVKGQMVLFRPAGLLLQRTILVGKRYLVPRADGRILAGSTEEPEAGYDKSTTEPATAGLIEFARELLPSLQVRDVETTWAGLRPGTADGLPYLGRVPGWRNLSLAAGHYRAGVQMSLATANALADLLTGLPPSWLSDFRLDRPARPPALTAFRS